MDKAQETTTKPAVSFDVFAVSKEGYEVHFQLSGEKAYCHGLKLLEAMNKDGFTPRAMHSGKPAPKGRQSDAADTQVCTVHNAVMRRHENDKGTWYSHKLADGLTATARPARQREHGGRPITRPPEKGPTYSRSRKSL